MKMSDFNYDLRKKLLVKCPQCGQWIDHVILEQVVIRKSTESVWGEFFEDEEIESEFIRCPLCNGMLYTNPFDIENEDIYIYKEEERDDFDIDK